MNDLKDRIIVALDTPQLEKAEEIIKDLEGIISYFKIGFELFTAHSWKAVELVQKYNGKVFLDLKLHDIPNTVSKTAKVISQAGVNMFNVHTLGGCDMMREAKKAIEEVSGKSKPLLIGVTILTSHKPETISEELGINRPLDEEVRHLALNAQKSGLDGIVCSAREVKMLREHLEEDFIMVTPGIRPVGSDRGDQERVFTPKQAFDAGSSHIVIGRPITESQNRMHAAQEILDSL